MNPGAEIILSVRDLTVTYRVGGRRRIQAVSGVSFDIPKGRTLGLVGESGCGKSSIALAIVQLIRPERGWVVFMGNELAALSSRELRRLRPKFQMIFQDSIEALNPRRCVGASIASPLAVMGIGKHRHRIDRAKEMLERVGLAAADYSRFAHEFSGGQRQRIQIARALISEPALLVCDEPVSSLDVSVQAQILNLIEEIRTACGITLLFISHDLAVVKNVSDTVAVMYMGRLCEIGPSEALYRHPAHPYTQTLLSAVQRTRPRQPASRSALFKDAMQSPLFSSSGCGFRSRCPRSGPICTEKAPRMQFVDSEHLAACHYPIAGHASNHT